MPDEQFSEDAVEQLYVNSEQEMNTEELFERKDMNRDLLKHTVFARQVLEQADQVEKINKSMFSEDGSTEMSKCKKQITKLRAKLNSLERERLLIKHTITEQVKIRRCYQDAAVLRHKLLKRLAVREKKQKKEEAEARAIERAARISALANQLKSTILKRPAIEEEVEHRRQASHTNTTRYRGSFMLSSSQKDMFAHISEISINTDHRRI